MAIPDPVLVQQNWSELQLRGEDQPFPFWTRVWPAAEVLSQWLLNHPECYTGKKVLELGAGLALPGFTIAPYVKELLVSDYLPDAVEWMNKNIELLSLPNTSAIVLNWHEIPADLFADLLLLSDVNYDPKEFPALKRLIARFLDLGTTIVLSTPHRITAGVFAEYMRGLEGEEWNEGEITVWRVKSKGAS